MYVSSRCTALGDTADVDHRAELLPGPPVRLHREGVHVRREVGRLLAQPVERLGRRDHLVAAPHVNVLAEVRLVARDSRELHGTQRERARGDVVGMSVAAVGTPGDDNVRPRRSQPSDDVADHVGRGRGRDTAIRIGEAGRRGEADAPAGFRKLGRARGSQRLARDRGRRIPVVPGLTLGQRQAVTLDARVGVFDEGAADAERLVVRMREDRRESKRSFRQPPDTSIRPVSGTRIVVIEDDPSVAELVTLYLKNAGFVVEHCATAAQAREAFGRGAPACVVMDLGLPDADGLDLFAELRRKHDSPVLAVIRRATGSGGTRPLEVGNLVLDPARHEVTVGGAQGALRAKEFELLEAFCRQPGIVLTRDKLLENVWGFAYPGETRTVDVHVKQLRDKLSGASAKIETVWGVGYKLVAPV